MSNQVRIFELPQEVIDLLGPPETAASEARKTLVLSLLNQGRFSHGESAAALGVCRWTLHDLMAEQLVTSGPETADEMRAEIEQVKQLLPQG